MDTAIHRSPQDWLQRKQPTLRGVDLIHAHFVKHQFERHWHESFSVGVTRSGVQSFRAAGSVHHSTQRKIICFNPGVAHDGQAGSADGFGYSMVYIDTDVVARWATEAGLPPGGIYIRQPLISDDATAPKLTAAFKSTGQPGESLRAYALLSSAVVQLLCRHGGRVQHDAIIDRAPVWIGQVREYLHAHFADDVTVEQLSAVANVSRVHLTRTFTEAQGIPPHAYLNTLRINAAKDLMRHSNIALADVALEVGYADQSHFCRRFKGSASTTPSLWRDALKN